MADTDASFVAGDVIAGLTENFFEAVRSSPDLAAQEARPAELIYELDQVVSSYLDEQQLSSDAYQLIQQDVLNNIAHDLAEQYEDLAHLDVSFDAAAHADPAAVMAAMDHHFEALFCSESLSDDGSAALG
jgi:K+-sensing histidine kinase KdpD